MSSQSPLDRRTSSYHDTVIAPLILYLSQSPLDRRTSSYCLPRPRRPECRDVSIAFRSAHFFLRDYNNVAVDSNTVVSIAFRSAHFFLRRRRRWRTSDRPATSQSPLDRRTSSYSGEFYPFLFNRQEAVFCRPPKTGLQKINFEVTPGCANCFHLIHSIPLPNSVQTSVTFRLTCAGAA